VGPTIHWRAALAKSPGPDAIYLKLVRSAVNLSVDAGGERIRDPDEVPKGHMAPLVPK